MLGQTGSRDPFQADGWRLAAPPRAPYVVALDRPVPPSTGRRPGATTREVRQVSAEDHLLVLDVDGRREVSVVNVAAARRSRRRTEGQRFVFERPDPFGDHGPVAGDGTLLAPMPGTVLTVDVPRASRSSRASGSASWRR